MGNVLATVAYVVARGIILLYTGITLPIYAIFQCPCLKDDWRRSVSLTGTRIQLPLPFITLFSKVRARVVDQQPGEVTITADHVECSFVQDIVNDKARVAPL